MRVRADYEGDIEFLDAGASHVGFITAKDQRRLLQLRVRAEGAGGVWTSLISNVLQIQQNFQINMHVPAFSITSRGLYYVTTAD